jgi:protein-L-isoaspartate(D-aspartate) O-methyltransferase
MSDGDRRSEREEMVARQLRRRGISDERVLDAVGRIPRHEFVPSESTLDAYSDSPLPIGEDQTISQPYIVAAMTEMLDIQPVHRVLEIGTGSGYQTAVLAELGGEIYTVEVRGPLLETALQALDRLGDQDIHSRLGDGAEGWPEFAPFDRIIGTACALEIPPALIEQLAAPGRLILPIGSFAGEQKLATVTRSEEGEIDIAGGLPVRFVMMTS